MTVTCPACNARYRDPPAEVPVSRPMQCGRCEHEFLRSQTPDVMAAPRMVLDAPGTAPDISELCPGLEETADTIRTTLPQTIEPQPAPPVQPRLYVDTLPPIPPQARMMPRMAGGVAFALAVVTGAIAGRAPIMEAVPQTAAFYQAAGLATSSGGLSIANVTTTRTSKDGVAQLIVRGEIENIAAATVPVPPIKLTMLGERDVKLYAWTVQSSSKDLKSGEKGRFTAVATDYPAGTLDVDVAFEDDKAVR